MRPGKSTMERLRDASSVSELPSIIKHIMKRNIDIKKPDATGRTALHYACMNDNKMLVSYLLSRNDIDVDLEDGDGKTALQLTPEAARGDMRLLFSKKAASRQARERHATQRGVAANEQMLDDELRESDKVSPATMRKILVCLVLPLLLLISYNGLLFALQFITATLCFYYVAVAYFVSEVAIRPPWYHHHPGARSLTRKGCPDYWQGWIYDPRTDFGLDYDEVEFPSTDGYTLRGWYVPPPPELAKQMGIVLVHGGGRDRRTWERHVPFLHNAGYGCLLFDFREHGLSSGNMRGFTFGIKERFDVVAACELMQTKYGHKRICAMGTSVGGASVIMAAAIDKNIDVVIAENAITTSATLLDQQMVMVLGGYFARKRYSVELFRLFRRCATFWLNWRIGNKPSKHCQALHCIASIAPRPILLMHGMNDTLVPVRHSEILFEAALEPKQLYLCEAAFHCGLYNTKPEEYETTVLEFLEKYGTAPTPVSPSASLAEEKKTK
ncbi:Ankyrin repeats protein [Novymonas esmeraldas]|uniref:Ankyrin repeats protein n=1 Tax=Novymonas esmeraldas TaxID=1808958 RepID=A0AAW0EW84_9TRYP